MKRLLCVFVCACGVMLSGCLDSVPKCNDEVAVGLVKEIVTNDKWYFVENGLTEQSLMASMMAMNGMNFAQIEALLAQDNIGIYKGLMQPMFDLRDYANEVPYISLEDFMTESVEKESKKVYCSATLKIEYPEMPNDMKQKYINGSLKGPIFDGGVAERTISYSARYTDDGKKIYVEFLDR